MRESHLPEGTNLILSSAFFETIHKIPEHRKKGHRLINRCPFCV
jgi:hypothetical protein